MTKVPPSYTIMHAFNRVESLTPAIDNLHYYNCRIPFLTIMFVLILLPNYNLQYRDSFSYFRDGQRINDFDG
jgi:hypothetical protein